MQLCKHVCIHTYILSVASKTLTYIKKKLTWITSLFQGKVVIIRGEGPKGGPGMPEMLTPTSAIMGAGLGKVRSSLIRFSL